MLRKQQQFGELRLRVEGLSGVGTGNDMVVAQGAGRPLQAPASLVPVSVPSSPHLGTAATNAPSQHA